MAWQPSYAAPTLLEMSRLLVTSQVTDLIEVTRLCTGVLNSLAAEQVQVLKELCRNFEEDVSLQHFGRAGGKSRKPEQPEQAFGSSAWADRMDKQEAIVSKYQVCEHSG